MVEVDRDGSRELTTIASVPSCVGAMIRAASFRSSPAGRGMALSLPPSGYASRSRPILISLRCNPAQRAEKGVRARRCAVRLRQVRGSVPDSTVSGRCEASRRRSRSGCERDSRSLRGSRTQTCPLSCMYSIRDLIAWARAKPSAQERMPHRHPESAVLPGRVELLAKHTVGLRRRLDRHHRQEVP